MPTPIDTALVELYRPFIGAVVFLLGAMIGSFINVVVYRLPKMMEQDWRQQCSQLLNPGATQTSTPLFNLAFPASHCPHCQHAIRWWENIPLLSYVYLRGKCANCQRAISLRYPLVELLTALLSTAVILQLGTGLAGISALLFTWALIALALIDFDTQLLPDDITLPLLWGGLLLNIFALHSHLTDAVIGAMAGYLSLWSIYWLFKLVTGKEGMGYGDFKLLAAFGAWLGWHALPMIILLSSVVGSVIGISLILFKGRDSQIPVPFGPYLAIAGWITLVAGDSIRTYIPLFAV
jgi:leader peptidase (prepilin peptidase)/N-methyltransferase